MKKTLLFLFITGFIYPQAPTVEWQKLYGGSLGENCYAMKATMDGGYILAGQTFSNDGDVSGHHTHPVMSTTDVWLVKTDTQGVIEWQRCYGGTDDETAYDVIECTGGGYAIAGKSRLVDGDVTSTHNNSSEFWIIRTAADGDIVWQKSMGGFGSETAYSISQTNDGGFVAAGYTNAGGEDADEGIGSADIWVVKLSEAGGIEWQNVYGGTNWDQAACIRQTSDGGYIVAGKTESDDVDVAANNGNFDCWILKLSASGAIEWEDTYGGTSEDEANSVIQVSDGGYVIAGYTESSDGDVSSTHGWKDAWIIKIDGQGTVEWEKTYGGTLDDIFVNLVEDANGNLLAVGLTDSSDGDVTQQYGNGDAWLVKINATGDVQWQKSYGGSNNDVGNSVVVTSNNELVVAGLTNSSDEDMSGNNGGYDKFLIKMEAEALHLAENDPAIVSVYPNPTLGVVNIAATENELFDLTLYDVRGKVVIKKENTGNIDMSALTPGVYFLKGVSHSGTTLAKKIVKL